MPVYALPLCGAGNPAGGNSELTRISGYRAPVSVPGAKPASSTSNSRSVCSATLGPCPASRSAVRTMCTSRAMIVANLRTSMSAFHATSYAASSVSWRTIGSSACGNGMSTLERKAGERITAVRVTEDSLAVDLLDGRTVIVPLAWYPGYPTHRRRRGPTSGSWV